MAENLQRKPLKDLRLRAISNKDHVAIFSGKCFMLADLVYMDIHPDILAEIIESMFRQSYKVLGEQ